MKSTFYFTKRNSKLGGGKLWFTFLTILLLILAFPSRGSADPAAADPEPYAVLSNNEEGGKTLTFYFGDKSEANNPMDFPTPGDYPEWVSNSEITTVVITKSFEDYYPTSCLGWFFELSSLTTIEGLEYLKTSNVTVMIQMFRDCSSLQSLDLSKFDVSKVEDADYMFYGCSSLRTIFVSKDWELAEGAESENMFYSCTNLYGGNGTAYDDNHTDAEYAKIDIDGTPGYFATKDQCKPYAVYSDDGKTLTFHYGIKIDADNPMDFPTPSKSPLWTHNSNITTVVINESFEDYYPTSCFMWFYALENLTSIEGLEYLETSDVTDMSDMFGSCSSLRSIDLSKFDVPKVTDMNSMFYGCHSLQSFDLSKFDVSNVKNVKAMFAFCKSLRTIFVSKDWELAEGAESEDMFYGCTNLYGGNGTAYDEAHTNAEYARIDINGTHGYFTKEGTTPFDPIVPYAVYSADGKTLYFYYAKESEKPENVMDFPAGEDDDPAWAYNSDITTVVITKSFEDYYPTSCYGWFYNFSSLTKIEGLEYLNTSEVTGTAAMFYGCSSLQSLDLSKFDVSKVEHAFDMFHGCSSLRTIFVSKNWELAEGAYSNGMFDGCTNLYGGNGTAYDEDHTDAEYARIDADGTPGYFATKDQCKPYAVLSDNEEGGKTLTFHYGIKIDADNPIDFPAGEYDLPAWASNSDITTVEITESFKDYYPTSCYHWFDGLSSLTTIEGLEYLKTSEVTVMTAMFNGCRSLQSIDLSKFEVENVEFADFMFNGCSSLRTIFVSKDWKLAEGASSDGMFEGCTNLYGGNGTAYDEAHTNAEYARIDINGTPGYFTIKEPYAVYSDDGKTLTFYYGKKIEANNPIDFPDGKWDSPAWESNSGITTVVITESFENYYPTSCYDWFDDLKNLTSIEGLEYLKTSEVTNMSSMFAYCSSLQSLDLSKFDVSKVTDMGSMFAYCSSLRSIDLSKFEVENVEDADYMFYGCSSLRTIFVSKDWELAEGASSDGMFSGCTNLYGGNGTAYDAKHTNAEYAKIDIDGTSGYFTKEGATPFDPIVPYAVYSDDGKTLYFYSAKESKKPENVIDFPTPGNYPAWESKSGITTVVITESFENYYPKSCFSWFYGLSSLTTIEGLEYLKTSKVTDMMSMFAYCSSLQNLDLSKFEVENVEYTNYMFYGCSSLRTIFVSKDWKLAEGAVSTGMFSGCTNLYGGNGTAYDAKHTNTEYARIDIDGTPGYFTKEGATPYEPYSGFTIEEGIATFPNSETEIVIRQEIKVKGVVLSRTFTPEEDGSTYPIATMALPFDVPEGEYEGGTFYEFTGIEKGDDGKWTAKMTNVAGNLEANKPYLFKPSAEKLTFKFSSEVKLRPTSEVISDNENSIDGWTFNAVYKRQTWGENHGKNDYFFTSQAGLATDGKTQIKVGDFVRIGSNCWLNPMRCYLSYNSISKAMPELPTSIDVILIDIMTPVSELTPATSAARVWSYSKTIFIEAQPGTAYQIIGINGAQLLQGITTSTRDEVSLPGNVDGIVIVKIGGKSFKIMY